MSIPITKTPIKTTVSTVVSSSTAKSGYDFMIEKSAKLKKVIATCLRMKIKLKMLRKEKKV